MLMVKMVHKVLLWVMYRVSKPAPSEGKSMVMLPLP